MWRVLAAGILSMMLTPPSWAQTKPDPFTISDHDPSQGVFMGRSASIPADARAAAGPGIRGAVLDVLGKPWWQLLSYCAGVYNYRWEQAKDKSDAAGQQAADAAGRFFQVMAVRRLEEDRKISNGQARDVLVNEMNYYTAAAADGGEQHRPFALDEARCRDVRVGYHVTFRPAPF